MTAAKMERATSAMPINASKWITASVLNANYVQIRISVVLTCLGAINAAKENAQAAQRDYILKAESARPVLLWKDATVLVVAAKNALSVSKDSSKRTGLANSARQ